MKTTVKDFEDLKGHTITNIKHDVDELTLTLANGQQCRLYHEQDCCESVSIDSVTGDFDAIIGSPLIAVREESTDQDPAGYTPGDYRASWTWSIFTFTTEKGSVVVRWLGESNGYYSESVYFKVLS